jgi:hypothetical protein
MTVSKFAATSLIALATLAAGSAFAAGNQPYAGEAPFAAVTTSVSSVSRATVQAEVIKGARPAAGESIQTAAQAAPDAHPTRAEVRAEARQAVKLGQLPRSGDLS